MKERLSCEFGEYFTIRAWAEYIIKVYSGNENMKLNETILDIIPSELGTPLAILGAAVCKYRLILVVWNKSKILKLDQNVVLVELFQEKTF